MADFIVPKGAQELTRITPGTAGGFQMPQGVDVQPQMGGGPDIVGRAKEYLTEEPLPGERSMFGEPEILAPLGSAIRTAGRFLLPGSVSEAAVQAVAGPASKLPLAGRAAATIGAGAGAGALTGGVEGAEAGGMTGAFSQAIGEVIGGFSPMVAAVYKRFGHFATREFNKIVRAKVGPKLAESIADDIPSLGKSMPLVGTKDIDMIVEPQGGQKALGRLFDRMEGNDRLKIKGRIPEAIGHTTVPIPKAAYDLLGREAPKAAKAAPLTIAGQRVTSGQLTPNMAAQLQAKGVLPAAGAAQAGAEFVNVPGKEAVRIVKEIRAKAAEAPLDAVGYNMRLLADESADSLRKVLAKYDRDLSKEFRMLQEDWNKFIDLRDFFKGNQGIFFPRMKDGPPTIDLLALQTGLSANNHIIDHARFTSLWSVFEGTAGAGIEGVSTRLATPRVVTGTRFGRVAESLPLPKRVPSLPKVLEDMIETTERATARAVRGRRLGTALTAPIVGGGE